jgi:hypothetical protein
MTSTLGVPVKLLHEALGHIITVELKTGQLYRGKLADGALHDCIAICAGDASD